MQAWCGQQWCYKQHQRRNSSSGEPGEDALKFRWKRKKRMPGHAWKRSFQPEQPELWRHSVTCETALWVYAFVS